MPFQFFRWPQLLFVFALAIALSFAATSVSAQSTSQLSAQILRLESQNSLLQSRLSRLEAIVSRGGSNVPAPAVPPARPGETGLATDPMFNRLATLVIELRDRIIAIEDRLGIRRPSA